MTAVAVDGDAILLMLATNTYGGPGGVMRVRINAAGRLVIEDAFRLSRESWTG